jgi:hypothetical protein
MFDHTGRSRRATTSLLGLLASAVLTACTVTLGQNPSSSSSSSSSGGASSGGGGASSGGVGADSGGSSADAAGSGADSGGSADGGIATGHDGGGRDAANAQCAYVDQYLKSGLIACPTGSNLCTIVYVLGSNGCYSSSICEQDSSGNVSCMSGQGSWSTTDCGTLALTGCGSTTPSMSTIDGPGSDGRFTFDGISYGADGKASPPSCNGAGSPDFVGTPAWSGNETVQLFCGDGGTATRSTTNHVSGIVFQPTDAGVSITDSDGCTYDFAVCNDKATLTSPVTCSISTDSGVVTEQVSSGTLTNNGGHVLTGPLHGTVTEGAVDCAVNLVFTLNR